MACPCSVQPSMPPTAADNIAQRCDQSEGNEGKNGQTGCTTNTPRTTRQGTCSSGMSMLRSGSYSVRKAETRPLCVMCGATTALVVDVNLLDATETTGELRSVIISTISSSSFSCPTLL